MPRKCGCSFWESDFVIVLASYLKGPEFKSQPENWVVCWMVPPNKTGSYVTFQYCVHNLLAFVLIQCNILIFTALWSKKQLTCLFIINFLTYIVYMTRYYVGGKKSISRFWQIQALSLSEYGKVVFAIPPVFVYCNITYIWSSYCPTVHNHLFSQDQCSVHSLVHSNATTHSLHSPPLSASLHCTELNTDWLTN
jgi:hypothetical protein